MHLGYEMLFYLGRMQVAKVLLPVHRQNLIFQVTAGMMGNKETCLA